MYNSARKMERWQRNPVFKTLQANPSEVEYADVYTYKTKVMQNKYCVEATKEFKVNHFGNGTIEESSPPLNREILKMYSSVVWFCQISKGIPKENSNRSQEFFFRQSLLQLQGSSTCNMPGIIFTPASMSAHIAQLDSPSFNCCCFKRSKCF